MNSMILKFFARFQQPSIVSNNFFRHQIHLESGGSIFPDTNEEEERQLPGLVLERLTGRAKHTEAESCDRSTSSCHTISPYVDSYTTQFSDPVHMPHHPGDSEKEVYSHPCSCIEEAPFCHEEVAQCVAKCLYTGSSGNDTRHESPGDPTNSVQRVNVRPKESGHSCAEEVHCALVFR